MGYRNRSQHHRHVDLHETYRQAFIPQCPVHRYRNNNLPVLRAFGIDNGDLRLFQRRMLKLVIIDIRLCSPGGIDQSVCIDKCEFFQIVQFFHSSLVSLQVFNVAQVFIRHQLDGDPDLPDIVIEGFLHHLSPPAGQFIQIQQAHGTGCVVRITAGALTHPDRADHQDCGHNNPADDRDAHRQILPLVFHPEIPLIGSLCHRGAVRPSRAPTIIHLLYC